ncbi:mcfB [Gossypium australe]|uniref:McfB n=1 Tax=Gossypium australe TaxID=47621 RepID=A0A5B6WM03_9ROSI|nr:mcfB [Gossypium australe]
MSNLVITSLYYGYFSTTFLPKDCSLSRNALLSGELILLPQDISVREVPSLRYASRLGLVDRSPCDVTGAFFQELNINLYQMLSKSLLVILSSMNCLLMCWIKQFMTLSFVFSINAAIFPLDLIRRRKQLEGAGGRARVYKTGLFGTFKHIFQTEGFRGLYRGILPEYYKVVPGVGICFMTYETLKTLLADVTTKL